MLAEVKSVVKRTWDLLQCAIGIWSSNKAFRHAGALAYYTLFSMAPLLIILVAIVGAVYGQDAARGEIASQLEGLLGVRAAEAVEGAVNNSRPEREGLLPTLLGVAALLFGATTVFAQMQASLNEFWGVTAKPSRSGFIVFITTRLISLGLVLIIGFLLLISFVVSTAVSALINFAEDIIPVPSFLVSLADIGLSLGVATLLFATIFKVLPDVRLRWRHMWEGAFVTAALFVFGKSLISLYLTQTAPESPYGAAGSLVIVLMWVYYSSLILFFGAALTRSVIQLSGGQVIPKSTAVRMKREVIEEE